VLGNLLQRFWLESQGQRHIARILQLEGESLAYPSQPQHPPPGGNAPAASHPHESARAQVAGAARTYVDDMPEVKGTLHAAPILSPVAHGRLNGGGPAPPWQMSGVCDVIFARDIVGDPVLAAFAHDEPIFAIDTVQHVGQVVGLVVATSVVQARAAARLIKLGIEPLPAVLTIQDALAAKSYVLPPVFVRRGDAAQALSRAAHTLSGTLEVGGQEHFYLEGQVAYALPQEQNQWLIYASTQHPGEVQHWVAHALGAGPATRCAWSAAAWAAALAARKPRPATAPCGRPWQPTSSGVRSSCGWTGTTTS
jgi:xanthine dehydrogenase large subunit